MTGETSRGDSLDLKACRDFQSAWWQGEPPAIERFLPPEDHANYLATLEELVNLDLELRYKATSHAGPRVENYLARFPRLDQPDIVRRLLRHEYRVRHLHGDRATIEEYRARFPEIGISGDDLDVTYLGNDTAGDALPPLPRVGPAAATSLLAQGAAVVPQHIGRYAITGCIGRGGMGIVYRGIDADLDRSLAVKVLLPEHAGDNGLKQRFLKEARIMGRLQHPGVPPIHEIGTLADGRPFFSMKQIQGSTLKSLLEQRRGPSDDLPSFVRIFGQVCQTVAYAHSGNTIHRDLKPDNIMVGAFGEVQVMDWGLAKVLNEAEAEQAADDATLSRVRAVVVGGDADTAHGTVLGTLAYMPPEQALGTLEAVDRRSDVFAIGAILCEILTGQPPYTANTSFDRHLEAARGDLQDADTRLQVCGADGQLIELARCCLKAERQARPANADEVVEIIAKYHTQVQRRLHDAQVAQATAQVKAAEERKRRRVTMAFAAVAIAFVLAASGAAVWYFEDQARRAEENGRRAAEDAARVADRQAHDLNVQSRVREALDEARPPLQAIYDHLADPIKTSVLLSNPELSWQPRLLQANLAYKKAKAIAATNWEGLDDRLKSDLANLEAELKTAWADRERAASLETIRQGAFFHDVLEMSPIAKEYARVFAAWQMDFVKDEPKTIAERIVKHRLRYVLVAALDHWADVLRDAKVEAPIFGARVLEVARHADPDPWRNQVRNAESWRDPDLLMELAAQVQPKQHSPQVLILLSMVLKGDDDGVNLLRRALRDHPQDFWLHVQLAMWTKDRAEKICSYRGALAIRPKDPRIHVNLGGALADQDDLEQAIAEYRLAIQYNPEEVKGHFNFGNALKNKGELDKANVEYGLAVACDPRFAKAYFNRGVNLQLQGDLDAAIADYRQAVACNPTFAEAYANLGRALRLRGRLDESIKLLDEAVRLLPGDLSLQQRLQQSKDWVKLERRLPAIATGEAKPSRLAETVDYALMCQEPFWRRYALSLSLFKQAIATDRKVEPLVRYKAACAAIMLAAGNDEATKPGAAEAAELRRQAHQWLGDQMAVVRGEAHSNQRAARDRARFALTGFKWDINLVSIREPAALKALAQAERQQWEQFWAEVDDLLATLAKPPKK
jgi:serine/threonine-protein kinase